MFFQIFQPTRLFSVGLRVVTDRRITLRERRAYYQQGPGEGVLNKVLYEEGNGTPFTLHPFSIPLECSNERY